MTRAPISGSGSRRAPRCCGKDESLVVGLSHNHTTHWRTARLCSLPALLHTTQDSASLHTENNNWPTVVSHQNPPPSHCTLVSHPLTCVRKSCDVSRCSSPSHTTFFIKDPSYRDSSRKWLSQGAFNALISALATPKSPACNRTCNLHPTSVLPDPTHIPFLLVT